MDRYLTRRYVAVSWPEAMRLAQLDLTAPSAIRHSPGVALIHRTDWWAWWSDQRLTTAVGLPDRLNPQGLSAKAVELITDVWASGLTPHCGWRLLAEVQRIVSVEPLQPTAVQGSSTWERISVVFRDGAPGVLYRQWRSQPGDCLCQIQTHPNLNLGN